MRQLIPIEYKVEVFPMMLKDAKERYKNYPTEYNLKRVAYWRQQIQQFKRIQNDTSRKVTYTRRVTIQMQ